MSKRDQRSYVQAAEPHTNGNYGVHHAQAADPRNNGGNAGHYYQGDYFAAPQMGGNAGGHGNHNVIFEGDNDSLEVKLQKIQAKSSASDKIADRFVLYSQVLQIEEEIQKLSTLCAQVKKDAARGLPLSGF